MRITPAALRPWRGSIRARIMIACAGLFLVPGAILIGAAYTQVGYVRVIPPGPRAGVASRQGNVTYFYDANNPQIINMIAANRRRAFLEFTLAGLGLGTLLAAGLGWAVSRRVSAAADRRHHGGAGRLPGEPEPAAGTSRAAR